MASTVIWRLAIRTFFLRKSKWIQPWGRPHHIVSRTCIALLHCQWRCLQKASGDTTELNRSFNLCSFKRPVCAWEAQLENLRANIWCTRKPLWASTCYHCWTVPIFIRGIRLQEIQLQNSTPHFVNWLLTVISGQRSTTLSTIDLFVDYITNRSRAGCCQKRSSPMQKRWKFPTLWKPPTPTLSPSRRLVQLSKGSPVNQTKAETQGVHATAADAPHTFPGFANSSGQGVTTVGRKAIYHGCADWKLSFHNHCQGHLSLWDRTNMDVPSSVTQIACKK